MRKKGQNKSLSSSTDNHVSGSVKLKRDDTNQELGATSIRKHLTAYSTSSDALKNYTERMEPASVLSIRMDSEIVPATNV